jgi:hypothetical protein
MKFSGSDFQLMRLSIAAISASVILGGLVLYGSQQYAEYTQKNFRIAQNQMNDARNRLEAAHQDQGNLAVYAKDYSVMEERKIIGDDHRLDWMEGLDKLRQQNLAVDFRYSITPQKNYAPQPAIDSGSFDIHYSEMKLQFDLLHEGQLLNFFSALRSQIKGQYQLDGCTMQRTAAGDRDSDDIDPSTTTHLKAQCSGGWITLKNRNAQP